MQNKPIKILGIDPGTNLLGWGLVEKSNQGMRAVDFGCIETAKTLAMADRLLAIHRQLCDIIKRVQPDEIAIEELFFFKNQKTIITVAQARGVSIVSAMESNLPVYEYTPLQIKQALTGYGRAEKKQMQEMVRLTCHLKECPKPDDAADALAVAICHAQTNQHIR